MRKLGLTVLLAALLAVLAIGCADDYPEPSITNLYASETCGVAPLRVDFRVETSGGKPLPNPTGSSNWLKVNWDFGDGRRIENGTSVAYHEYAAADLYVVTVTVEDDLGEKVSRSIQVRVDPDTLSIRPYARIVGDDDDHFEEFSVTACWPVTFGYHAETCGFAPAWESYDRFVTRWDFPDNVYMGAVVQVALGRQYAAADTVHLVTLLVEDPSQSIFRLDTLRITNVQFDEEFDSTDLSLSADWLQTVDPEDPNYDPAFNYNGGGTLIVPSSLRPQTADDMPVFFTYTIRLKNDGLASAYNLALTGQLHGPGDDRYAVLESAETSIGTLVYSSPEKRWTWRISEIASDSEELLHITFSNRAFPPTAARWPNPMSFDASIINAPYPCDVEQDGQHAKWSTQAVLRRGWTN